jgi:hypothetical protein
LLFQKKKTERKRKSKVSIFIFLVLFMEADQMKNILFTRCLVNDKVCDLYIDRKYWINMASTTMVEKWELPILEHPKPYILHSLEDPEFNDMVDVLVTKQVRVSFILGEYEDEILCDVVPSKTRDLLLGLPWQHKHRAKYDRHTKAYTFSFKTRQITLTHDQVDQDQIMKREIEKEFVGSLVNEEKQERVIEKKESDNKKKRRNSCGEKSRGERRLYGK